MAESTPRKRLQRAGDWIARRYSSLTPGLAKSKQSTSLGRSNGPLDTDPLTTEILDSGTSTGVGIKFKIAPHDANPLLDQGLKNPTPVQVLKGFWKGNCYEMYQSSLKPTGEFLPDGSDFVNCNGFVNNIVLAYNKHHHLIIRPDDIWVAILTQFNLYVNANAEDLRNSFVAHEGKKALSIVTLGTRYTIDYGEMAKTFARLLEENIVDPSLRDWIIPQFTTTTPNDEIVCSMMMMATLKAYFTYDITIECGIPSITLLGTRADYESIHQKLDKLEEFGVEPAAFAQLLRPVLAQFVAAFDAVENGKRPDPSFWQKICHYRDGGSGAPRIGGWITAFCVWNKDGKWQGTPLDKLVAPPNAPLKDQEMDEWAWRPLLYEGLYYPTIESTEVPIGYAEVDVKVAKDGVDYECMMVAGHVGARILSSKENARDTLQPASEWFMFAKHRVP